MRTRLLGFVVGLAMVGGGAFGSLVTGVSADPEPVCFDKTPTIIATGGTTNGTSGSDVILGSSGDDTINGGGGNDYICDTGGYNLIHGDGGNDQIVGVGELNGDSGNDFIIAVDGTLVIDGGSGHDEIQVFEVSSEPGIWGGSGNDEIYGNSTGTVDAGSGNDYVGFSNAGYVDCGSGRDEYDIGAVQIDIVRCEQEVGP